MCREKDPGPKISTPAEAAEGKDGETTQVGSQKGQSHDFFGAPFAPVAFDGQSDLG